MFLKDLHDLRVYTLYRYAIDTAIDVYWSQLSLKSAHESPTGPVLNFAHHFCSWPIPAAFLQARCRDHAVDLSTTLSWKLSLHTRFGLKSAVWLQNAFKIEVFDPRELEVASSDNVPVTLVTPVLQVWIRCGGFHSQISSLPSTSFNLSDLSQPHLERLSVTRCHSMSLGVTRCHAVSLDASRS